jgi:Zn finger protein HypA/HybF involved in hydrogenase expression
MLAAVGCSKESQQGELLNSDANGFLCRQCNAKFFTSRSVYADHCPSCKSADVALVIGFYCDKDQHVTLTPKAKSVLCEKCNQLLGQVRLPTSAQLVAWGAVKKSEADVK